MKGRRASYKTTQEIKLPDFVHTIYSYFAFYVVNNCTIDESQAKVTYKIEVHCIKYYFEICQHCDGIQDLSHMLLKPIILRFLKIKIKILKERLKTLKSDIQ